MTIFRVNHNKNYTVINNTICTDKRLSWKAKGIWLYAFSRPDDWSFHLNDLINQSTDGRDSVKNGLCELENTGYLIREQLKDEKGHFDKAEWTFYETSQDKLKEKVPRTDFPSTEKPLTEKRTLLSTDVLLNTEKKQQQQEQTAVAFFDELKEIQIPEIDKIYLSKTFAREEVIHAIAWSQHLKTKIKTTLQQALKWACERKPEIPKNDEQCAEENKQIAQNCEKTMKSTFYRLDCHAKEIEIVSKSSGPSFCLKYAEKGFKELFIRELEKKGFIE